MEQEIKNEVKGLKIGEKILSLRKAKDLSTADLAKKCGVSEVVLSQIESDIISPTVAALLKIAKVFDKELNFFFQDGEENISIEVVRKNERKSIQRKRSSGNMALSYSYQSLAFRKAHKHMQPLYVEFDIDIDEEIDLQTHEGEEFLYLVEGELEMRIEKDVVILKEGDSVYFDSTKPHAFIGKGPKKPKAVVTIYTSDGTSK